MVVSPELGQDAAQGRSERSHERINFVDPETAVQSDAARNHGEGHERA
jgi:hypothetical protein